jgi:hypothetical protein
MESKRWFFKSKYCGSNKGESIMVDNRGPTIVITRNPDGREGAWLACSDWVRLNANVHSTLLDRQWRTLLLQAQIDFTIVDNSSLR